MKKKIQFLFIQAVIFVLLVVLIFPYVLLPVHITGNSMETTLSNGDYVLINVLGFNIDKVDRFDIVVLNSEEAKTQIVKRVIGLPGEKVEYKDDILYINDQLVEEKFLDKNFMNEMKLVFNQSEFTNDFSCQLKDNEYFVLGDNRIESADSRNLGVFKKEDIIGINGLVFYPFNHIAFLN